MNQLRANGANTSAAPTRRLSVRPENTPLGKNVRLVPVRQFPHEFSSPTSPTLQRDGTLHPLMTLQVFPCYPWSSVSQPLSAFEPPCTPTVLAEEPLVQNRPNLAGRRLTTSDERISSVDSSLSSSSSFETQRLSSGRAQPSLPMKSPMNMPTTPARGQSQLTPVYFKHFKTDTSIRKLPGTPARSCLKGKTASPTLPAKKTPESSPNLQLLMTPGKARSQPTNATRSESVRTRLPDEDESLSAGGPKRRKISKAPTKMLSSLAEIPCPPAPESKPSTPENAVITVRKLTPATPRKGVIGTPIRKGLKLISNIQIVPPKRRLSSFSNPGVENESATSTQPEPLRSSSTQPTQGTLALTPNPPKQLAQTKRPGTLPVAPDLVRTSAPSATRQNLARVRKGVPGLLETDFHKMIVQRLSILEKDAKEYGERITRLEEKAAVSKE